MNKDYLNKLVQVMKERSIDAMLVAPSEDLSFLIGSSPSLCARFQALFIKDDATYFYICNLLTQAEVQEMLGDDIKVYGWFDGDGHMEVTKKAFEENGLIGKKIGVNAAERAFLVLDIMEELNVKFVNGKPLLDEMRIIKSEEELENMRIASRIADEVITEAIKYIKPGLKEGDVLAFIQKKILEKGGDFKAKGLVCRGSNSAHPHYSGNQGIIEEKDIVLIDFGCKYKGLCSDITRTVFVGGITDEERKMYEYVLAANLAGIEKAVDGAYIPDIDKAARDIIDKSGYGDTFITRLGHGMGYATHEAPDIKQSNKMYLKKGMAFSIEPGIYRVGEFGIRIEDAVIVTENGTEVLNKVSKDIIIV